jgi:hypothetical protein
MQRFLVSTAAILLSTLQVSAQSLPEWAQGDTLEWRVTVSNWFAADQALRLKTAAWYLSSAIPSDVHLLQLMESGEFRRESERFLSCLEETARYLYSVDAISASSQMNDLPLTNCMLQLTFQKYN